MTRKGQTLILLILTLGLLGAVPAGAATVADVPTGHWAYEAVSTLVEKGYLHVGEDQLFRGDQPADRYTLATVVAKILTEIESGRVSTTPDDVRTLRLLVDELRADLVKYYADAQKIEGEVNGVYEKLIAYDERLMHTIAELGDVYRRTTDLEALVAANAAALDEKFVAEVSALRSSIDTLGASLGVDLHGLRGLVDSLGEELDRRTYELSAADAALRQDIATLGSQTQQLGQSLQQEDAALREQIAQLKAELKSEADALLRETARLADLIAQERAERELAIQSLIDVVSKQGVEISGQLAGQAGETTVQISELRSALQALEAEYAKSTNATGQDIARLEQLIAETRDGVYDNAEGLVFLSHSLEQAEQKQAELAQRVDQVSQTTSDQFSAVEQALLEIRSQLQVQGAGLASSELSLGQVHTSLQDIRDQLAREIEALDTDLATASEALARVDGQLLTTIEQLRQEIAANKQSSAAAASRLADLEAALNVVQVDLLGQLDTLAAENASMKAEMSELRQELLMLQSQVGLSEEQVHELTQRVKEDMANQLTLSLVREGELQRSLAELRKEFDSYRETSEQQLRSASSAQALGIGALVLGLIGLLK